MKVMIFGYRHWARRIFWNLFRHYNTLGKWNHCFYDIDRNLTSEEILDFAEKERPDYLFFVGWSWLVKKKVLDKYKCLCLHPSPLPKYRGGCPIQHQIINGEKQSAVSLFMMTEGIDDGDIIAQKEFPLDGTLDEVFEKIINVSTKLIIKSFDGLESRTIVPVKQDHDIATTFKRRKPKDSKLTFEHFREWDCETLYNFIRCLDDPYPNAYIEDKHGNKLLFKNVKLIKGNNHVK